MSTKFIINIGRDFSRFPVGRYLADGEANGQKFREQCLVPALMRADMVVIEFDDALGYGSSFLEEAFGGLVRSGRAAEELLRKFSFVTEDDSLREEILQYINEAAAES